MAYNFTIGGLGFHKTITPERPYERATAPFRKEQFDAAPTVGDQSLSGWWTRGQLSFHKGAGVEYYEVLEGEEILDRYKDSLAVEISDPGQVTLTPELADLAFAASKAVPGALAGEAGLFALTPTGVQFYSSAGVATPMSTSDSGLPTDITSDGRYYYAPNGNRIERQAASVLARTNHVTNPSFETDTAGWAATSATIARDVTTSKYGSASLKVTPTDPVLGRTQVTASGLTVGTTYVVSYWRKTDGGSTWTRVLSHQTVAADNYTIYIYADGTTTPFFIDGVMVTESPFEGAYFDGDTVGNSWEGTPHASKSTYAAPVTARTNHVTNPSFEVNTTGWSAMFGTVTRDTTEAYVGSASLKVVGDGVGAGWARYAVTGLTVGATYRMTTQVKTALAGVFIPRFSDGTSWVHSGGGGWELFADTFTATATSMNIDIQHLSASTTPFFVDAVMVTEAPFEGTYFDGSSVGGAWLGAAHASKSTVYAGDPASSVALWEHGEAGATWQNVWWAKGRLWAVDNAGRWFTLSTAGGTVQTTEAFWSSGRLEGTWTLAEGSGPVYVGHESEIFGISLQTDGAVPVVEVPSVVATIPKNETISHLDHYLGHLLIATGAGVRMGLTGQSGELVYGPLVIKGDFSSANATAARDTRLFVVGVPEGHTASTVCALDLGSQISDLRPAWSPYHAVGSSVSTESGVVLSSDNKMYAWAAEDLYGQGTALAPSGYLYTGLHRFGTLEPKHFSGVKVRLDGTGGSVAIYSVLPSGSETLLDTVNVSTTMGVDVALSMTAPVEAVGLKFVLTRDGTDPTKGPVLLGYQLKALPAPRRQRLVRVPLMMFDTEQGPSGRSVGKEGSAWTRLAALEALEETNALVSFTDTDTGETGTAYIESLELTQTNGPRGNSRSNGFGGILTVTLRKV